MTISYQGVRAAAPPTLLPLLRSSLLGELLAWIYLHPEMNYSVLELAQRFKVSRRVAGREIDRLVEAGLVRPERRANLYLVRAELAGPAARPLTELLELTYGPAAVLAELLPPIPGVAEAYLYGSWAARCAGRPGPPPRDVDVLVLGDARAEDLGGAAAAAERRLGREVNIYQMSLRDWRAADDSVRSGPAYAIVAPGRP
jgi:DNA-binding transcriptional ArsR family regulator